MADNSQDRRDRGPGPRRHGRPGPPPQQPPRQDARLEDVWPGYIQGGYFDAQGALRWELVSRSRVEPLARAMAEARPGLTPHQARRFFQHCRAIEARLRAEKSPWALEREQLLRLDVFAADAFAKTPPKVPRLFHDFIQQNVQRVVTQDDFLRGFLPHFEALLGFGARYFNRNRDRT